MPIAVYVDRINVDDRVWDAGAGAARKGEFESGTVGPQRQL
jgi:hypothetical protein